MDLDAKREVITREAVLALPRSAVSDATWTKIVSLVGR
jgi:hypothetical protein